MSPLKFISLLIIFYSLGFNTYAQVNEEEKELNLSIFLGLSVSPLPSDFEKELKNSGLGDTHPIYNDSGSPKTPYTEESLVTDLEANYFFNETTGLSCNFALFEKVTAKGFEDIGNGNLMTIHSEVWSISMSYSRRSKNRRHFMNLGPSFIWHSYKGPNLSETFDKKIGMYMGYSYHIVQQKNWFLSVKINYRLAPKSAIGPFIMEHTTINESDEIDTHTSTFPITDVNISTLNIGGAIGVKFNWKKY